MFTSEQTDKNLCPHDADIVGGRQAESKIVTKMYGTFHLVSVVERLKAEKYGIHFLRVTQETGYLWWTPQALLHGKCL